MVGPEQSIRVKDLIFIILRAWRQVIVFAIVGVILLAGFAFYRGRISNQPSEQTLKLTDKEIEEVSQKAMQGDPEILERTDRVVSLETRSDYLSNRLANSVYLSINEKAQPVVTFDVIMIPQSPSSESDETYEQREYLLSLEFLKITKSNALVDYLASQCMQRVEAQWIMELLTSRLDAKRALHFEVTAPDLETAESLAGAAEEFFSDIIREHLEVTYLFDVEIRNHTKSVEPNPAIREERSLVEKELSNVRSAIEQEQEAISLRIEEILDRALEEKIEKTEREQSAQPKTSLKRNMLKYGIAGALIGILIAAFIAVFRATSSSLIWSPEEYADQLKLLYIGSVGVAASQEKKKFGSGLDRWLERLFYRKKGAVHLEDSVSYALSVIEGLGQKEGISPDAEHSLKIAVMGDAGDASLEKLVEGIQGLPSMKGIKVVANTEEGIKALRSADAVVQLVQARQTSLRKAIHDLELATGMGVRILGIIGVETV